MILHKIKDDSFSNDDKASLFLKSINDDPILLTAPRQDKKQPERKRYNVWVGFIYTYKKLQMSLVLCVS